MSGVIFLNEWDPPEALPPTRRALREPNGLLAVGGALTPEWLLHAYRRGVFPWFSEGQPILWWTPDPRAVLFPDEFRRSRSLAKSVRNRGFETRLDSAFADVVAACAAPRREEHGTWITPAMYRSYVELHERGIAHSVETWQDGRLVGGLYGVAIGRVFFGESMFSRSRDASKVALSRLVDEALDRDVRLVDCQMETAHLASLGSRCIPRRHFEALLDEHCTGVGDLWRG
ncbi:MAG: leucyl/phenylalanyl-tRNA--protein transferase [Proteobacteria bacterium]|nr:leucyl/phenylalanyl-tRNA--protein transferase [Pseudomonadota bacterium]